MFGVKIRDDTKKETRAQLCLKIVEPLSLFFVQKGDDLWMGADSDRLGVRLERYFFAQLTNEIIGGGWNGLYLTSPVTIGTRGAQLVLQTFARSFAGHLNQTQLADFPHITPGLVLLEGCPEGFGHFVAVDRALHIDKVDDNQPANIA